MQAAGELVILVRELAARVQAGQDHFHTGEIFTGVLVHGHAPAVIRDRDGVVLVQGDLNLVRMANDGLIDAVVDDFLHHVIGPGGIGVHPGTLAHRFETG